MRSSTRSANSAFATSKCRPPPSASGARSAMRAAANRDDASANTASPASAGGAGFGQRPAQGLDIDRLGEIVDDPEAARFRQPRGGLAQPTVLAADDDQLPGKAA